MNIKNFISKTYLCIGLLIAGCAAELKETPYSFIGPEQIEDSMEGANQWVTGVYNKLSDDMFRWDHFPKAIEIDCDYTSGPDWSLRTLGAGNFQGDDTTDKIWQGNYLIIHRANTAIKYVSAMKNISSEHKNNALGELHFLKGFAYFMLVKAYGDIPLFDKAVTHGADYNQPRRPISEVYQEIIRLLTFAKDNMYKHSDAKFAKGHASAGAAAGLLVKVYATMASGALPAGEQMIVRGGRPFTMNGNEMVYTDPIPNTFYKRQVKGYENFDPNAYYQLAVNLAEEIEAGKYGMYELLPYANLWKRTHVNAPEHMFRLQSVKGDEKFGNGIFKWHCGVQNSDGVIIGGPFTGNRDHWYKLFDANDLRIVEGVMHRWQTRDQVSSRTAFYYPNTPEYAIKAKGEYDSSGNQITPPVAPYDDGLTYVYNKGSECLAFTTKYQDVSDPTVERNEGFFPFLRYADVLLLYAEALTELDGGISQKAIDVLNRVRARSNAVLATTSGNGAITTKVALRSAIFEERAKELALEGDRRWDLIRWGVYLDVMNSIGGADEVGIYKVREERNLLYPIPQKEIISNEYINENNPGWN